MSYSWLRENSKENMPVTQGDLQNLEDYADRLFSRVGIDVAFTRHFLDRVNDERNQKQITIGELIRIFKQEYKYYGKKIAQLGPDAEAVMKDMKTDVNIPFALHWDSNNNELDLVAKTVMRKKDFKTSNPEFAVADVQPDEDKVGPNVFENLAPNSEIYVDMDGVLADFFGEWAKLMGVNSWKQISNVEVALDKVREQDDFWVNLPMTSNAKTLLSAIKKAKGKYNILSAPLPDDPNSAPGKQEWIKKNLANFPPEKVILDHDKAKYAKQPDGTPNALIDDYGENIKKWEAAGGIGIKHENNTVQSTVNKLDREVEPMTEEDFVAQFRRYVDRKAHSGMYSRAADAFHKWLKSEDKPYTHSLNFYAMEFARRYLKVDWRNLAKAYTDEYGDQAIVKEDLVEAWSKQYKDSIDCSNPKGFSQKAHCAGRKKNEAYEINGSLVDKFLKATGGKYSKRDQCGPACIDFISWAKKQGVELKRVRGEFVADEVVSAKADFTPEMKKEFAQSGLDWNSAADRKAWIEQSKYAEEWKRVPHYWTVDKDGNIHDPSGYQQLVKTGLAKDLDPSRYIPEGVNEADDNADPLEGAAGDWLSMMFDNNDIETILNAPDEFKQAPKTNSVYRAIFKDRNVQKENAKSTAKFIPYSTSMAGAHTYVDMSDNPGPYYIIEKKFNAGDMLVNFQSIVEHYDLLIPQNWEDEVWMKRTPYYTKSTKDEIVFDSEQGVNEDLTQGRNLNDETEEYIKNHKWKLTTVNPANLDVDGFDDPFGRVIDVDPDYSVNFKDPIIVHADGKTIIDGFHRAYQAQQHGLKELPAYVPEDIEENLDNCKYGKYYCSTDKKWKCRKGPKQTREEYSFIREGVGIITKQNTTVDVKPGETQRQAKKLGMYIDSKGSPPLLHKKAAKNSDPNTLSNLGIGK